MKTTRAELMAKFAKESTKPMPQHLKAMNSWFRFFKKSKISPNTSSHKGR